MIFGGLVETIQKMKGKRHTAEKKILVESPRCEAKNFSRDAQQLQKSLVRD